MKVSEFDFELPKELIAQVPVEPRDHARLMVVNRQNGTIEHDYFYNLPNYLKSDDLVVFNQTKVIPARILTTKPTGGRLEVFLHKQLSEYEWECLTRPGITGKFGLGEVLERNEDTAKIRFNLTREKLLKLGEMPLPPYIRRFKDSRDQDNYDKYQTIYARDEGSVAAPTAGFHFTQKMLDRLPNKAFVTLHVGLGTFAPVKVENIEEHKMHAESYWIPEFTMNNVKFTMKNKKRIVAVGTTSVRTLESWGNTGKLAGETNIFIYPGYEFKVVDAMVTNFHLPKSTLLMLVSAFAGRELIRQAYAEAVKEKYRFFSFGDGMVIV